MKEEIKKLVESLVEMYKIFDDKKVEEYLEKELERIVNKYK